MRSSCTVIAIGLSMMASVAHADSIDFTKLSYGPSSAIYLDGLTVRTDGSLASVVEGQGLGVGDDGVMNQFWHSLEGGGGLGTGGGDFGTLQMTVDGRINSVTIQPFLTFDGPPPVNGIVPGFVVTMRVAGSADLGFGSYGAARGIGPSSGPVTIAFKQPQDGAIDVRPVTLTDIGFIDPDHTTSDWFRPYLLAENFPDVTFTYGFSITSVDFDRIPVPEPSTWLLLALAGGGLLHYRRRRSTIST